jgi:hypothetical protein
MARKTALVAAAVGGLGWLVKVVLIWGNGGTNLDQGVVAVAYVVGLLALVTASAAAGAALARRQPWWIRGAAAVLGVVVFFLVSEALDAVVSPLAPAGTWQRDEVSIVATAVLALACAAAAAVSPRWRSTQARSASA